MLSESQRAAFRFLRSRATSGELFSAADIEEVAAWQSGSFATYKTKHLKDYVTTVGAGKFTIAPHFLRLSEDEFHGIVTQSRKAVARFARTVFNAVLRYEFLLPLTNERKLRAALDELFYRDNLAQRANEIGLETLATIVPRELGEHDADYRDRIVAKVGALLGGYSIGHVHGRFRVGGLRTHEDAAAVLASRGRYLVDETTAVVRFLLPLQGSRKGHGGQFHVTREVALNTATYLAEVDVARRLFIAFFVESVILDIHGEDEIWFLESGPGGEQLYVLEKETPKAREAKEDGPHTQLEIPNVNPLESWLAENGYDEVLAQMRKIINGWKKRRLKTRRNWWEILAGDIRGEPRAVAGEVFPIIAAIRKRQELPPVPNAISRPTESALPPSPVGKQSHRRKKSDR